MPVLVLSGDSLVGTALKLSRLRLTADVGRLSRSVRFEPADRAGTGHSGLIVDYVAWMAVGPALISRSLMIALGGQATEACCAAGQAARISEVSVSSICSPKRLP
ncbi:hypothetical protein MMMDOFMJ_1288 [Methylobacterium gnaphalii]|nr:hypothetical protein MMMDOFMJ_1288 [Methylobacterium gnaphalii]